MDKNQMKNKKGFHRFVQTETDTLNRRIPVGWDKWFLDTPL